MIKRKGKTNTAKRKTEMYLCKIWLIDARILYCANFITKKVIQGYSVIKSIKNPNDPMGNRL